MSKKLLLFIVGILLSNFSKAQWNIYDGDPHDSIEITFDSLQITDLVTDSSGLWQIGNTNKAYFIQGGVPLQSIMTDTTNSYPVNANAWFEVQFPLYFDFNAILAFTHKYQTETGKDGGIIEFSSDSGQTWQNVLGDCNMDTVIFGTGVHTENLYSYNDTLQNGEPAFTGESNGWIHSRIQFFDYIPVKGTASCDMDNISVRFRFVSDSTSETMDGWIISKITFEQDGFSSVENIKKQLKLDVYPNPSYDGILYFPELENEKVYRMEIINSLGQTLYRNKYQHKIDLGKHPKGLYYYRVIGESDQYSGQILLE